MNVAAIKDIMRTKQYISVADIKVLTGCSTNEARRLRISVLDTYLPMATGLGLKTKVRLDKFLEYYNSKELTELYHDIIKGTK